MERVVSMATFRAQIVDLLYQLPDREIPDVMEYLNQILKSSKKLNDAKKKTEAFERLEAWREKNKEFFGADFDWRREVEEGIREKYGLVD